jgi:hypothetical protein
MTRTLILWESNPIESGVECVVRDDFWWLDRGVKLRREKRVEGIGRKNLCLRETVGTIENISIPLLFIESIEPLMMLFCSIVLARIACQAIGYKGRG